MSQDVVNILDNLIRKKSITPNDDGCQEYIYKELKDFGRKIGAKKKMLSAFQHDTIGYNFKFTEFQAAIGISQMKKLEKRMKIVYEVGELKQELEISVEDLNRENEIIQRLTSHSSGELTEKQLIRIFSSVFKSSKQIQRDN